MLLYRATVLAIAVLGSSFAGAAWAKPQWTKDCNPCILQWPAAATSYDIYFEWSGGKTRRGKVRAISLSSAGLQRQVLPLRQPPSEDDRDGFFFGIADLGAKAEVISFSLGGGSANAEAQYWILDRRKGRFRDAGVLPTLTLDPSNGKVTSYQTGGHGGRDYVKTDYVIDGVSIRADRIEKQSWNDRLGKYVRVTSERTKRGMRELSRTLTEGD